MGGAELGRSGLAGTGGASEGGLGDSEEIGSSGGGEGGLGSDEGEATRGFEGVGNLTDRR